MKRSLKIFCALCLTAAIAAAAWNNRQTPAESSILLETEAERTAWLNLRGWQVGAVQQSQTQIPQTWKTPAGQRWLQLQHAQGLEPLRFGGKPALRCVYPVENSAGQPLYAELLLCEGVLVGAQVYNAETQIMQSL